MQNLEEVLKSYTFMKYIIILTGVQNSIEMIFKRMYQNSKSKIEIKLKGGVTKFFLTVQVETTTLRRKI